MPPPARMPALDDDVVAAVGFASANGVSTWVRVWRERMEEEVADDGA